MAAFYLWGRMATSLPDLHGWHTQRPLSEFCAGDAIHGYTFDDYLEQEQRVFKELDELIAGPWASDSSVLYNRFQSDSICNPANLGERNWNRSFVLEADQPIGGVLLLHGLSDASTPYGL